jgi:hypothetical protein
MLEMVMGRECTIPKGDAKIAPERESRLAVRP